MKTGTSWYVTLIVMLMNPYGHWICVNGGHCFPVLSKLQTFDTRIYNRWKHEGGGCKTVKVMNIRYNC